MIPKPYTCVPKSPEMVSADALVAIANALERIADGQAQKNYALRRITMALESERLLSFSTGPLDPKNDVVYPEEW